jgi:peptidoglycan/xylan/chitin deacetylase (PgdA/CDA1 family)
MHRILTYHTVGNYERILPAGINLPIEVFRAHMDYLFQHQYRIVPLGEVADHFQHGREMAGRTLAITFDDGYEDHFTTVYPILKEYGFPATIFLTVKYINGYWESEKATGGRIKGLSKNHILEMHQQGLIQFGSHGCSHRNFLSIDEGAKISEIRDSKSFLEDLLGEDVPFISYPFGAFDEGIKNIVRETGYKAGFSIWSRKPDIYSIRRIPLHTHDGLMRFKFKVSPLYFAAKSLIRFS